MSIGKINILLLFRPSVIRSPLSRAEKFSSGNVTIKILPPIQTEGIEKDQIDNLIKETRDSMIEGLKILRSNK